MASLGAAGNGGPPKGSLRLLKKKIRTRQTGTAASGVHQATTASSGGIAAGVARQHVAAGVARQTGTAASGVHQATASSGGIADCTTDSTAIAGVASVGGVGGGAGASKQEPDLKFFTKPALKWTNPSGQSCIPIRGESRCLCGCRKKVHKWDGKRFRCSKPRCKCKHFFFIVAEGAWKLRCRCKHAATDHNPAPGKHECTRSGCKCNGFVSPWVCNCGEPWTAHTQSVEQVKFVSVNGTEMPASMFAQMVGIDPTGEGIAPEINRVSRDPKFGQERY